MALPIKNPFTPTLTILLSPILHPLSDSNIPANKVPNRETATKQATPRLLSGISRDVLQKEVAIILGDMADARTRWMVDTLLTATDWIDLYPRPSLFTIRLTMLDTQAHSSFAADIGL